MTALDLAPLAVELLVLLGALTLLVVDLVLPPDTDRGWLGWTAAAWLLGGVVATFALDLEGGALAGAYRGGLYATYFKRLFLIGGLLAVLGSIGAGARHWARRQVEHHQLVLYSVLGMCLLAGARDLLLVAVAFELMGLPLVALAAWQREDPRSVEGALKLYLTGAVSSAVTLFGLSLLVGTTEATRLVDVADHGLHGGSPLFWTGVAMTCGGLGFKIAVFPFHVWVPDTYQGAPTPVVAFLSVAPKAAALAVLLQLLLIGDGALLAGVWEVLAVVAAATLVVGNGLALPQDDVKRLLGYSGVGHMGLLLVALVAGDGESVAALLFYLLGYLFTSAGAFLVVHAVRECGGDDSLASLAGLGRRSGWLALSLLVFLLSLAGIPFVVGFWAKLYVFLAAWRAGQQALVVLALLVSVAALFYYLRVARAMLLEEPTEPTAVEPDAATQLGIAVCLVFVVGMGLQPEPFLALARAAASTLLPVSAWGG